MKSLEFQISQLRQDKIIYAVEAVAVNVTCLIASFLWGLLIGNNQALNKYSNLFGIIVFGYGILFTFFALIGNVYRLQKIKQLERKL